MTPPVQVPLFEGLLPELKAGLSQWHTPRWLARRAATWIPQRATVLEPCAGGGALLEALLWRGLAHRQLLAVELDPEWVRVLEQRYPTIQRHCGSFLSFDPRRDAGWHRPRWVFMNPPYEDDLAEAFVLRALQLVPHVVAILPASIEFGQGRHERLWRKARVARRARCMRRPRFGSDGANGSGDIVCLYLRRRRDPEGASHGETVREERWI